MKDKEEIVLELFNNKIIWRMCNNICPFNNQLASDLECEVVYKLLTHNGLDKFYTEYREYGNWYNYLYVIIKNEYLRPSSVFYRELRKDSIKLINYDDYKNETINNEEDNERDQY